MGGIFINNLNPDKFRSTNQIWNNLKLNIPWSVGYVSTLIQIRNFKHKEEWENYYYNTGRERLEIMNKIDDKYKKILNNSLAKKDDIENLPDKIKNINYYSGRTNEELSKKGFILFNELLKNKINNITHDECTECVRFRVICETWNGIIQREKNTIKFINKKYPNIDIRKVIGENDYNYAVDYEIFLGNKKILALQIKPISYLHGKSNFINSAKRGNKEKNDKYFKKYRCEVLYVYSELTGNITNKKEIFDKIQEKIVANI